MQIDWKIGMWGLAVPENGTAYLKMDESEKKRLVFELILQGLNGIAAIDKLDKELLSRVLDDVD